MYTWIDYWVAKEIHEDRLSRAEHARLVQMAERLSHRRPSIRALALAWLGRQMISFGSRLQARYGSVSPFTHKPRPTAR